MRDLPPDLERLRVLETWLLLSLDRVREQIAAVERETCPHRAPAPPAGPRPAGPPGPPTPAWGIADAGLGIPAPEVHRGDCWARGATLRPVSAEEARTALAEGVQACEVCRPDRVLTP
ncbi:DUF6233 domain-containing protein [Streptomyces sp. NRRL F-3273]|uniref:DUF6233 domain-containing protein n=1 Tax=Streptomyces sp. NRRL F-3273 TaxID=1463848 RepID=UPI0004C7E903|nr:DUF6233 domain-containing protein [Streptomyces sp. NRRL F-3273]